MQTDSPTGYRMKVVEANEGEMGHRIGAVDSAKPALGLAADDPHTVCLVLDLSDPRIQLDIPVPRIPILFRFPGVGNGWLSYRLQPDGTVTIVRVPSGVPLAPWAIRWVLSSPRGNCGLSLEPIPERLHNIFHLEPIPEGLQGSLLRSKWSWYARRSALPEADVQYVEEELGYFGNGFHQLGGTPGWIQGRLQRLCPDCRRPMDFLLSLGSHDKLGWEFPEYGRLYALICEKCSCVTIEPQFT